MTVTPGKTIRIYLAEGSPSGIRHAELVNWTGQAFACPRARVASLADWPDSQRQGVYVLLGEHPESQKQLAYIGEAENVFERLKQHVKTKEFWEHVIFFTSKDENLTKAHVKYLESRVVELALKAGRAKLENGNTPLRPALPRADRDAMEEFLGPVRLLLTTLGTPLLQPLSSRKAVEPKPSPTPSNDRGPLSHIPLSLTMYKGAVTAMGVSTDEGFVVMEGSVGASEVKASMSPGYRTLRDELLESGDIVLEGTNTRFARDVLFKSPSAAGAVCAGTNLNGRKLWQDSSGRPLSNLEEAMLENSPTTLFEPN